MSARMMCVRSEQSDRPFRKLRNTEPRPTGCGNNISFKPAVGPNLRGSSRADPGQEASTLRPDPAGYPERERYVHFAQAERPQESWTRSIQGFFDLILEDAQRVQPVIPRRSRSLPHQPPQAQEVVHHSEYPSQSPTTPRLFVPGPSAEASVHPIHPMWHGVQRIEAQNTATAELQNEESQLKVPHQPMKASVPIENEVQQEEADMMRWKLKMKADAEKEKRADGFSILLGTPTVPPPAPPASTQVHRLGSTLHSELRGIENDFTDLANDLARLAPTPRLCSEPAPCVKAIEDTEHTPLMTARTRARYDERLSSIKKMTSTVLGHGDSINSELRGLEQDVTQLTREMEALKAALASQEGH